MNLSAQIIITSPEDGDVVSPIPVVVGTAVPNNTVEITVDGTVIGTTTADANGQWSVAFSVENALPIGATTIVATDTINRTQDQVDVIVIRALIPVTITSPSNGDIFEERTPPVSGEGEQNTTVTIITGGEIVGTTEVDGDGNWTWTPDSDLNLGEVTIIARGEDGSEDQVTITIVELSDGEYTLSGGRFFGC